MSESISDHSSSCVLCECNHSLPCWDKQFRMVICQGCGLMYMDPVDWKQLEVLYRKEYDYGKLGRAKFPAPSPWDAERHAWIATYDTNFAPKASLLEIGCNAGALLSLFDPSQWDVLGVEPGESASTYARESRGLAVETCFWNGANVDPDSQDVVVMISVLEHFQDPISALHKVHATLRPNGRLVAELPNVEHEKGFFIDSTWKGFQPTPEHLFCYSKRTLQTLLSKAGFGTISIVETRELLRVTAKKAETVTGSSYQSLKDDPETISRLISKHRSILKFKWPLHIFKRTVEFLLVALLPHSAVYKLRRSRQTLAHRELRD